jgi:peptidyl-prolyl cis-trans isomerase D
MLDGLRRNTKVVLWITVAAFVLLIFLVWGAETQVGCGGPTQGVIGRVNGEPITVEYFNRVYQASRENFKNSRGVDPGPGDEALMLQQTWDGIVEQTILSQEAKKRGLVPTDQEIVHEARNNPPPMLTQNPNFQTDGRFDQQKYLSFLDNPQVAQQLPTFYAELESYLREMVPVQKLTSLVYGAARVSDPEIRQAFLDRNEQAKATYRLFDLRKYTLPQPITDAEAEAYFKAHPDEFNLPAQATVRFTRLERKPTDADVAAIRQQMVDYAGIARRFQAGDSTALNFAALAETYSDLPTATNGGLVDRFYGRGELSPEIEAAAFSLPLGGISDPIQDRSGFHLIQVDSVMTDSAPPAAGAAPAPGKRVRLRDIMLKLEPSEATLADLEQKIKDVKEKAADGQFEAQAKAAGLEVTTAPPFAETAAIRGMENVAGATPWAFHAEPGSLSPIFAMNDAWYLAELVSRSTGKPAYKDVAEIAKQKATEAGQRALAQKDAQAFLDRARSSSSWRALSGADSMDVRTVGPFSRASGLPGIGREADALGAVFSLSAGQVAGPINTTRAVIVLRVDERIPVNETLFAGQKDQLAQQLASQRRTEIYQDWLKQLKDKAEIKDFRELYFRS